MKKLIMAAAIAVIALLPGVAQAGVSGPAFYVNGTVYRTVGTPTDLSRTGAPAGSFDHIYDFGGNQMNVATAAPGDTDYSGGRWLVHALGFNTDYATTLAVHDHDGSGAIDTNDELFAALSDGGAAGVTDLGIVKRFVCPVIPLPGN